MADLVRRPRVGDVARAFVERRPLGTANLFTDGCSLWSYQTLVAWWDQDNRVVLDKRFYSRTTSRHLGLVKRMAGPSLLKGE